MTGSYRSRPYGDDPRGRSGRPGSGRYGDDPGSYDLEVPLLLHEFDPYFASASDMDLTYRIFTINGKMLGAGEPVRVRAGQRVLFRIVNASAT